MRILNLYAGLGGNRTHWNGHDITAIEIDKAITKIYQEKFPDDRVFIMDVHDYLRDKKNDLDKFDFIWASPPCQTHSQMMKWYNSKNQYRPIPRMDEVYGLLIWLPVHFHNYFCIENVQSWYVTPIEPTFKIGRHLFWANFQIPSNITKKNQWKHGRVGGIMRENKTQAERNKVAPAIGKYILDHAFEPGLMSFIEVKNTNDRKTDCHY